MPSPPRPNIVTSHHVLPSLRFFMPMSRFYQIFYRLEILPLKTVNARAILSSSKNRMRAMFDLLVKDFKN
jgi:hypothetical protein